MVRTAHPGSAARRLHRRRSDSPRPEHGRPRQRDRQEPRHRAPGVCHPDRSERAAAAPRALQPDAARIAHRAERPARPADPDRRRQVTERVPRLSYFFPAHNEEANLRGLVEEALATLPTLAETWEIVIVNDGSRDDTATVAAGLTAAQPGLVRAANHPTNAGYGAALLSGFRASRLDRVALTDGDRQFRVADLGRLTERLTAGDVPDVLVGYRIKRADP